MRAVVVRQFGPPSVLVAEDVVDPTPGAGQVLVDVSAIGITFVETQIRAGRGPNPAMQPALPYTPGNGVAGVVAAVGDGVDAALIGRRVVTTTGGRGGYAARALAKADDLIDIPDSVSDEVAVALLADGRTATGLVDAADPQPGEWALVLAAAGGLGGLAVQLLQARGASVIGAAGGAAKVARVLELGAHGAVDYSIAGWTEEVRSITAGRGVDIVFDGVGGEVGTAAASLVADSGRLLAYGAASGAFNAADVDGLAARAVRWIGLASLNWTPAEITALSKSALAAAAAGTLQPTIGQRLPLEQAADAHATIEARQVVGKSLLLP